MVTYKQEFLEKLNRTERATIKRMNAVMSAESKKIKELAAHHRLSCAMTIRAVLKHLTSKDIAVKMMDNTPCFGKDRVAKIRHYSIQGQTYDLPKHLQFDVPYRAWAHVDPITGRIANMSTTNIVTGNGIRIFHTDGEGICYGTSKSAVMRSELESAFEVLDEVTSCVNASSIMGTEGFLYPIEQFATWQRRVLEDEKYYKDKYGEDEFDFRWADRDWETKTLPSP